MPGMIWLRVGCLDDGLAGCLGMVGVDVLSILVVRSRWEYLIKKKDYIDQLK